MDTSLARVLSVLIPREETALICLMVESLTVTFCREHPNVAETHERLRSRSLWFSPDGRSTGENAFDAKTFPDDFNDLTVEEQNALTSRPLAR